MDTEKIWEKDNKGACLVASKAHACLRHQINLLCGDCGDTVTELDVAQLIKKILTVSFTRTLSRRLFKPTFWRRSVPKVQNVNPAAPHNLKNSSDSNWLWDLLDAVQKR